MNTPSSVDYSELQQKITAPTDAVVIGRPQQKAKWHMRPDIRVCKSTEVTISRASRAIRFWESLGYDFGSIRMDAELSCMNPRYGEIIITLPEAGFANEHLAATRIYTHTKSGDILKASIFILPIYARKDRVLEHEIGHALGWSHYSQRYHIMHPSWEYGGYGKHGLKR